MRSIVTIPAKSVPEGVAKFLLIDGQQRITTVYLILMAIGDLYCERGEQEKYEEIKNIYLVNPYKHGNDSYKLLPTQIDRSAFKRIINSPQEKIEHDMWEAYMFFKQNVLSVCRKWKKYNSLLMHHLLKCFSTKVNML